MEDIVWDNKFAAERIPSYQNFLSKQFYTCLMFWAGGKKYESIASELNIPVGTVKSRIHRAKKLVDKKLNNGIQRSECD